MDILTLLPLLSMNMDYIHSDLYFFHQSFVVFLIDLVYILLDLNLSTFLSVRM